MSADIRNKHIPIPSTLTFYQSVLFRTSPILSLSFTSTHPETLRDDLRHRYENVANQISESRSRLLGLFQVVKEKAASLLPLIGTLNVGYPVHTGKNGKGRSSETLRRGTPKDELRVLQERDDLPGIPLPSPELEHYDASIPVYALPNPSSTASSTSSFGPINKTREKEIHKPHSYLNHSNQDSIMGPSSFIPVYTGSDRFPRTRSLSRPKHDVYKLHDSPEYLLKDTEMTLTEWKKSIKERIKASRGDFQ